MLHMLAFKTEDLVETDVFHCAEDVSFNIGICLLKLRNQMLGLKALRAGLSVCVAGGAGCGKTACTLYEIQAVVISPMLYFCLMYKIKRSDELHSREIGGVKLGHHSFVLSCIKHSHKYSLDDIVEMMAESYLVASQLLGFLI